MSIRVFFDNIGMPSERMWYKVRQVPTPKVECEEVHREFAPEHPLPRKKCSWYGFAKTQVGSTLLLCDTQGNQCPWHNWDQACPCEMEILGVEPNATVCQRSIHETKLVDLSKVMVYPRNETGVPADLWEEYIMSERCLRLLD